MIKFLFKLFESQFGLDFPVLEQRELLKNRIFVEVLFWNLNLDFVTLEQQSSEESQTELCVGVGLLQSATRSLTK